MLGKRNVNCLSCTTDNATNNHVVLGKDGRYYKADAIGLQTSLKEMTLLRNNDDQLSEMKGVRAISGSRLTHKRGR